MNICVKTNSKVITVSVEPSDTIRSVKEKIEGKEGHPVHLQKFIYGIRLLEDEKKLSDYGLHLQKDCTILLALALEQNHYEFDKLSIQNDYYGIIDIEATPTDRIEKLKEAIEETVKTKSTKTPIPLDKHILLFDGKRLQNDRTCSFYEICGTSKITLIDEDQYLNTVINIVVGTLAGDMTKVAIKVDSTVGDLKTRIYEQEALVPSDDFDTLLVKNREELDDLKRLFEYDIGNDCFLQVHKRSGKERSTLIRFKLPDNQPLMLPLFPSDTINDVKKIIARQTFIRAKQLRFMVGDVILRDDKELDEKTVSDCNLKSGDVLVSIDETSERVVILIGDEDNLMNACKNMPLIVKLKAWSRLQLYRNILKLPTILQVMRFLEGLTEDLNLDEPIRLISPGAARTRFIFEVGSSPTVGNFFVQHPINRDCYVTPQKYSRTLAKEKEKAFLDLAGALGAKTVTLLSGEVLTNEGL